jgi:hypothetical protein
MKKIIVTLLAITIFICLAACGNDSLVLYESPQAPGEDDVFINPFKSVNIGDLIQFGSYNWRVLDIQDGKALILSDMLIELHIPYHSDGGEITWERSSIRQYLNDTLYDSIFNDDERELFAEILLINNDNPWYGTDGGNDTTDRIFLLSIEEVVKYFGDSGQLHDRPIWDFGMASGISDEYDSSRIAHFEDFVQNNSLEHGVAWWLRSTGEDNNKAATISRGGSINIDGLDVSLSEHNGGVRPALWLILDSD